MNPEPFSLKPFPGTDDLPDLRITGTIVRRADLFSIEYAVTGDLSPLAIPAPAGSQVRSDRIWEETCLEFFLGLKDSEIYWEFNLSPAGHWNAYRFASYRKGMREEETIASLPFLVRTEPNCLRLSLEQNIGKIVREGKDIEVGICAVVRTVAGKASHWALAHPGHRPDFHRRDGFTLTIPAG